MDNGNDATTNWVQAAELLDSLSATLARALLNPGAENAAPYVGVFASARDASHAPRLHQEFSGLAIALGNSLGQGGFSMLTGGCPGIVDAAQAEFVHARVDATRQRSVGIRISALGFDEPANPNLDVTIHAPNFGARLELMHRFCQAAVVLPGGLGSLLELAFYMQYSQAGKGDRRMPICLFPRVFWTPLLGLIAQMQGYGTISPDNGEMGHLHLVDTLRDILRIVRGHNGTGKRADRILGR